MGWMLTMWASSRNPSRRSRWLSSTRTTMLTTSFHEFQVLWVRGCTLLLCLVDAWLRLVHIIKRFQIIGFCSFYNTVNDCGRFGSMDRIDHLPVLLSDTETTDCPFGCLFIYEDKVLRMQSDHSLSAGGTGCSVPVRKELPLVLLCIQWLRWQKRMTWIPTNIWHISYHSGQTLKCQMNSWNSLPHGARLRKRTVKTKHRAKRLHLSFWCKRDSWAA